MFVVVPNVVGDEINRKLDEQIALHPDAAKDREVLYKQLVAYFNDHGSVPDFSLQRHPELQP